MNALAILARAEAAGVTLQGDDTRLLVRSEAPPTVALLHELAGARDVILDLLAERAAIQAEQPLPPSGSAERECLERKHSQMVAGLLKASRGPPSRETSNG